MKNITAYYRCIFDRKKCGETWYYIYLLIILQRRGVENRTFLKINRFLSERDRNVFNRIK